MSGFDKRQKDSEARFKHDQELQFKANNRRNKLLGQWAAGLLGLSGKEADDYAIAVVQADFQEKGDDDVLRKVLGDLKAKGVAADEHKVRKQMNDLMEVARRQVMDA